MKCKIDGCGNSLRLSCELCDVHFDCYLHDDQPIMDFELWIKTQNTKQPECPKCAENEKEIDKLQTNYEMLKGDYEGLRKFCEELQERVKALEKEVKELRKALQGNGLAR